MFWLILFVICVGMLDLLILFLITAFILNRLFSVLGKSDDDGDKGLRSKSNSIIEQWFKNKVHSAEKEKKVENQITDVEVISAAEASLPSDVREVMRRIRELEPEFDVDRFFNGARKAFSMIISHFSQGDKRALEYLLDSGVYKKFAAEIDKLKSMSYASERSVINMRGIEIVEAKLQENKAIITVAIQSDQIYVLRDNLGNVLQGNENKVINAVDSWTFAKQLGSTDPVWKLIKTS
ncbi:conserved hypothetical protein [Alphaproteobacteria bacterium]